MDMNVFQESCCSFLAVLLVFLLQGSRADDPGVHVHKAVGDSLDLITDYPKNDLTEVKWKYNGIEFAEYENNRIKLLDPPLFDKRIKMNKDNISITVEDLKLQDSGFFSIVAEKKSHQYPTKLIVLHVHDLIRDVQIKLNHSWIESKNICVFHLWCQASGDPNPSYSWSGDRVKTGPNLSINLHLEESATVNCTANNIVSTEHTTKTVTCRGKSNPEEPRSRADDPGVHVHKAVGDSLDLITDYPKTDLEVRWKYNGIEFAGYENNQFKLLDPPLFHKRIKMMNKDNISITVEDLKLQDSGFFSIVAEKKSHQYPTKVIMLHVHGLIRDVQIKLNHSWIESKNICRFHFLCQASGDPNPSYSWSGDPVTTGPNLSINLHLEESATVNCTANNTVSAEHTTKTVTCRGKSEGSRFCVNILNS